ncbi:MAG: type II secretion system protein [Armatimonadetes bacterium]|nr:prepilin-type N-terminal cleavage/methylation domain-containing protein [Armatimonadota bacterium]MBS1703384.1 type II secretion system protein [Armatimonadota bacterium]MBS1727467.1 type II secretion system protein [Armatimonadota bacterium]
MGTVEMKKRAFTMIELLTVIAIIALLSAIIFPVFARVKLNAYKSADMSSMNSIRSALQLYRDDQGGYPPHLLGYISPYEYQNGVTVVPANLVRGPMYPKRITSIDTLKGGINRSAYDLMVPGIWPQADTRTVGSAPILDLNGDGVIDTNDDILSARQQYSTDYTGAPQYYLQNPGTAPNETTDPSDVSAGRFYAVSGYDVGPTKLSSDGNSYYEMHYTLFWTTFGLGIGSALDDPRQLGYSNPPDTTVVTWDTFYRDYNSNFLTPGGSKDIVLFLGGSARPLDSKQMSERAWRMMP